MFYVDIYPWANNEPNQEILISSFEFSSEEDAVVFASEYNIQSQFKVALPRKSTQQLETA